MVFGEDHSMATARVSRQQVEKPLVDEVIVEDHIVCRGVSLLFYRKRVHASRLTRSWLALLIGDHRRKIGSRYRKIDEHEQALLVLVYLLEGETYTDLAVSFGVGTTTAWRYVQEGIMLAARYAPSFKQAARLAAKLGFACLDGTLILIDRVGDDRPYYSGKHKRHGVNVQVIAGPTGEVLWVSAALPGSTHDLTAARAHKILKALQAAGLTVLADKGYIGAGGTLIVPVKGKNLPDDRHEYNRAHAALRGPAERANAQLKQFKILTKLRCSPSKATPLVRAVHAIHLVELDYKAEQTALAA
jgi:hypothetical protein